MKDIAEKSDRTNKRNRSFRGTGSGNRYRFFPENISENREQEYENKDQAYDKPKRKSRISRRKPSGSACQNASRTVIKELSESCCASQAARVTGVPLHSARKGRCAADAAS